MWRLIKREGESEALRCRCPQCAVNEDESVVLVVRSPAGIVAMAANNLRCDQCCDWVHPPKDPAVL